MNKLIKMLDHKQMYAQLWIGQKEGIWSVGWSEFDNGDRQETIWYEGCSWSELLRIYRKKLSVCLKDGYKPMFINGKSCGEPTEVISSSVQKLHCYSDLYKNEQLYHQLYVWRRKKASKENKAPYFIASNQVLHMISAFVPYTMEELIQIPGIGPKKIDQYGQEWTYITSSVKRHSDFPLDWVSGMLSEDDFHRWLYMQKEKKYNQDLKKFQMKQSILEALKQHTTLNSIAQQFIIPRREVIELLEELDTEGYDVEPLLEVELKDMSGEQQHAIQCAFEQLGDTLLKPILEFVYGGKNDMLRVSIDTIYEQIQMFRIRYRRQKKKCQEERNAG